MVLHAERVTVSPVQIALAGFADSAAHTAALMPGSDATDKRELSGTGCGLHDREHCAGSPGRICGQRSAHCSLESGDKPAAHWSKWG